MEQFRPKWVGRQDWEGQNLILEQIGLEISMNESRLGDETQERKRQKVLGIFHC